MNLRTLFVVDAAIASAFGLGLIAVPALVTGLYGTHLDAAGVFLGRLLGAFVLGHGLILWLARDATASPAALAITRAHAVLDWIGVAVCAAATVGGVMNGMGWTLAGLFALFGGARVYFGFVAAPRAVPAQAS
jgi:hypothetical protein